MAKPKTTAPDQTFLPFDLYLSENIRGCCVAPERGASSILSGPQSSPVRCSAI